MSNDYYEVTGTPGTRTPGTSASIRAEFAAIEAAFDKLPVLTGNVGDLVAVGGGGVLVSVPPTVVAPVTSVFERIGDVVLTEADMNTALGQTVGFRKLVPASVTSGAVPASDVGKCVFATGNVTFATATFAKGDAVTVYNTTGGSITISGTATLYLSGTGATGTKTLATKGIATLVFESASAASVIGAGLS